MPAPSKKNPAKITKALAMHRKGASAREIAEELKVSHVTVTAWLRDAGVEPNGGGGPRKSRVRKEPPAAEQVIADTKRELAELEGAPPPHDRLGAIEHLGKRLKAVEALLGQLTEGIPNGATNPNTYAQLAKLEAELASRIAELTPPEAPDPEKDPTNLDAAAKVRRRFAKLVQDAEATVKCAACGANPYVAPAKKAAGGR